MLKQRALVWFKRDLCVHDHVTLFVIEPEWLRSPECDLQ